MSAPLLVVEISAGELLDKITILRLKQQKISDPGKLANVRAELEALEAVWQRAIAESPQLDLLAAELQQINTRLWDVEDDIRACEAAGDFGAVFIELARSVYHLNDRRGDIKRRINLLLGSRLIEEKQYRSS